MAAGDADADADAESSVDRALVSGARMDAAAAFGTPAPSGAGADADPGPPGVDGAPTDWNKNVLQRTSPSAFFSLAKSA